MSMGTLGVGRRDKFRRVLDTSPEFAKAVPAGNGGWPAEQPPPTGTCACHVSQLAVLAHFVCMNVAELLFNFAGVC